MKVPFWLKAVLFLSAVRCWACLFFPTEVDSSRWLEVKGDVSKIWTKVATEKGWSEWNPVTAQHDDSDWLSGRVIKISESDPNKLTVEYVIEDSLDKGTLVLQPLPENKGAWIKWIHTAKSGYSPIERLKQLSIKQKRSLSMDKSLERLATLIQGESNEQFCK